MAALKVLLMAENLVEKRALSMADKLGVMKADLLVV
jgi:hypothetical protein